MGKGNSTIRLRTFCLGLALYLYSSWAAENQSFPKVDPAFWRLKIKTIADDSLRLDSLRGKYVLLNFWGEWCQKCQEEIPFLVRQEKKYARTGFKIVGFLKSENRAKAKKLLKENGADWTQVELDPQVEEMFHIRKFPTNLLISPDGEIVMEGFSNHYQDFKKRLESSGPAPEVKQNEISAPKK